MMIYEDSDGCGFEGTLKKLAKLTQSIIILVKLIEGTNRNITANNWLSFMKVVEQQRLDDSCKSEPLRKQNFRLKGIEKLVGR